MARYKCEDKDKTTKFLSLLSNNLFASSRNLLFTEFPHILIRMIYSISIVIHGEKHYTIHNIIKDLCQPPSTKHFSPEKMSVGIKAFIIIIDPNPKKQGMLGFQNTSDNFDHLNRFSTIKNAVSKKNSLFKSEAHPEKLMIIEYFFETLYHLDISYGRPFMATIPSSSTKFSTEQLNQDKKAKILLFKHCISFIPKFFISNEKMDIVAQLLSRLTLHTDEDIKARAFAALKILIVEYIELRSIILQAQLWRTCLSNELFEYSYQDCFYSIEGFSLIALCSPDFLHQNTACQILKENKSMRTIFLQHDETIECCLYDEIYKFLVERCPIKCEGYSSNIELMFLFDQNFHGTPWYQVLACMFRESQISYNCGSAVDYARSNSYARFISSHSPMDLPSNHFELSSRLTLTKTKKSPFQFDSQLFQNYLILFCSPAIIGEQQLNFLVDSIDNGSSDILLLISVLIS
ncbi:hypothetical protein MXB_2779 [Myxobolus squamalis]|nr:hypothetical protein MXB_2779 [Myxobolus squamalis]